MEDCSSRSLAIDMLATRALRQAVVEVGHLDRAEAGTSVSAVLEVSECMVLVPDLPLRLALQQDMTAVHSMQL